MAKGINNIPKVLGKIFNPKGDIAVDAMKAGARNIRSSLIDGNAIRKNINWGKVGKAVNETGWGLLGYMTATGSGYKGAKRAGVAATRIGASSMGVGAARRLIRGQSPIRDRRKNLDVPGIPFI